MSAPTADSMTTVIVDPTEVVDVVTRALVAHGALESEARLQAAHLLEGDLRGHPSHGIRRLATLAGRLDAGLLNPRSAPTFDWTRAASLVVDGDRGFGPVVAGRAVDMLLDRAGETGIASAALHNTQHLGMLAPYAEAIVARGGACIILTTTEGLVHPWNGRGALVGTNPICIGVPSGDEPVILDMSTAMVSAGAIIDRAARGIPIPEGWAVDAAGRSTTEASAARSGAISPFGGAKGFALGIAFEALVGLLTATAFGASVSGTLDVDKPVTKGDLFIVFSPAAFGGSSAAAALVDYLELMRASGVDGAAVTIPGDRARSQRLRSSSGVQLDARVWQAALDLIGEK